MDRDLIRISFIMPDYIKVFKNESVIALKTNFSSAPILAFSFLIIWLFAVLNFLSP